MKEIHFKTIPHKQQRYDTCGDYFDRKGIMEFRVSDMRNSDYEFLVLLHEFIEWYLINKKGISIKEIDDFDITFEKERAQGLHSPTEEPGDDPKAPYYFAHQFASKLELLMCKKLRINWKSYLNTVEKL